MDSRNLVRTSVHTLYYKININKMFLEKSLVLNVENTQQYQNDKEKVSLPNLLVLHVYISSTITHTKAQRLYAKIPSLKFVHILYNNTNINIKAYHQNDHSYICTYPIQQHKSLRKISML